MVDVGALVAGLPVGLLLSTGAYKICTHMSDESFMSWGWRVPFLLGLVLTIVGYFIRRHVAESPLFEEAREKSALEENPILKAIRQEWRHILAVTGARVAENACFYLITVFVIS